MFGGNLRTCAMVICVLASPLGMLFLFLWELLFGSNFPQYDVEVFTGEVLCVCDPVEASWRSTWGSFFIFRMSIIISFVVMYLFRGNVFCVQFSFFSPARDGYM